MRIGSRLNNSLLGPENGRQVVKVAAQPLLWSRLLLSGLCSRFTNPRFVFSLAALAVLGAKFVHIGSHASALPTVQLVRWGYSFFAQDIFLLIILRLLLGGCLSSARSEGLLRRMAVMTGWILVILVISLNMIHICFFAVAGSEIHWQNMGVAGDAAGRALLLTGLVSSALVAGVMMLVAWPLKDVLFVAAGLLADVVCWPFSSAARHRLRSQGSPTAAYLSVPQQDAEHGIKDEVDRGQKGFGSPRGWEHVKNWPWMRLFWIAAYALAATALLAQLVLCILRPRESSLTFMSWTTVLLPFVDFKNSSPSLEGLVPHYNSGINHDWDGRTALTDPIALSWLPKDSVPQGFEDWYNKKPHYNAAADPLKISNLDSELLPELRKLKDEVPIRHIVTILLESTRKDLFPIKNDGVNKARLQASWENGKMPKEALERLRTLTPNARFLTGDHDDGFDHGGEEKKSRGGLSFNDAYTTSTYTIKSLVGTLCGISPLLADFNLEYKHHIYQPCLPQVLDALNTLDQSGGPGFTPYRWNSSFMQSVSLTFDSFDKLLSKMGFPANNLIGSEYLRSDAAKFGRVNLKNVNYFGMQETPLEDYMRDRFETAKKTNERVYISHLTSTSHHPYGMPEDEKYVPLGRGLDDLSHYINAIGYDDRWLGKITKMLDDLGVANETLLVLVGDHGLSIPENDILASYYNPNIASNHVPLVLSHPKLPPITVDDAVSAQQVLPTILDLLIETGSLSKPAAAAAGDLLRNYEGQSLIRPVKKSRPGTAYADAPPQPPSEVGNWHFTVINPGRAMVGVRDARRKSWRLVVPVVDNIEWRFTDAERDPRDADPVLGFDLTGFLANVEEAHGPEPARWVEEAAFIARWWVEEISRRWQYGPKKKCHQEYPICNHCSRLNLVCRWEGPRDLQPDAPQPRKIRKPGSSISIEYPDLGHLGIYDPIACGSAVGNGARGSSGDIVGSRRMMLRYYTATLVFMLTNNVQNNCFLSVLLPMAFESPALMYALAASSSAHLALQDEDFKVAALQHSGLALAELKASMSRGTLTREMRLAATLVLCSMESISCGTGNWDRHLSGAAACLEDKGHEDRQPLGGCQAPAGDPKQALLRSYEGRWLLRNFAYHDIIMSVSLDRRPMVGGDYWVPDSSDLADPYFGLAARVVHLIGEISVLNADFAAAVPRSTDASTAADFSDRARSIETQLLNWKCPAGPGDASLVSLAEAYRHGALIHLYRVLRRHVPYHSDPLRRKTRKSVDAVCAASGSMPKGCYAETSMIFPLFMAGGEAETAEHVGVVREGLQSLNSRRRFRNADACVDVLDEVWRLAAAGTRKHDSAKVDWLDVAKSRNWKLALF
ncbi:alkaline phosphatase-like protein [Colletotrichum falcatum]|nr:alkaline phosphatase-like protein [Colletotrichum falcatum]